MKTRILFILVGLAAIGAGINGIDTDWLKPKPSEVEKSKTTTKSALPESPAVIQMGSKLVEGRAGYKYLSFVPKGYGNPTKKWPMILFLHGQCSNEDLGKLKGYGPIKYALAHPDFPFIAISPATSKAVSYTHLTLPTN